MAIEKRDPNTIWLGPGSRQPTTVNDLPAGEALTPGHLLIRSAGTYLKHNVSGGLASTFCVNQPELNNDCDDVVPADDLCPAMIGTPGDTFWAWLASGQNVTDGAPLMSAGTGLLTAASQTYNTIARALEDKDARYPVGSTRIRVELV